MPWTYEVRHWSNGRRTIEIYEKREQAYKRSDALNKNAHRFSSSNRPGPAIVAYCCSTHDVIEEFREIRKKQRPAVVVAKGGAL